VPCMLKCFVRDSWGPIGHGLDETGVESCDAGCSGLYSTREADRRAWSRGWRHTWTPSCLFLCLCRHLVGAFLRVTSPTSQQTDPRQPHKGRRQKTCHFGRCLGSGFFSSTERQLSQRVRQCPSSAEFLSACVVTHSRTLRQGQGFGEPCKGGTGNASSTRTSRCLGTARRCALHHPSSSSRSWRRPARGQLLYRSGIGIQSDVGSIPEGLRVRRRSEGDWEPCHQLDHR